MKQTCTPWKCGALALATAIALAGCAGKPPASSPASSPAAGSASGAPEEPLGTAKQLAGLFDGTVTEGLPGEYLGQEFQMHFPDFVQFQGKTYAYYISYPSGYAGPCIGVAVSEDDGPFTKLTDTAIVTEQPYDSEMASFAGAWVEDGTVYVVYEAKGDYEQYGFANIALATSTDGVTFEKKGIILMKDTSLDWQDINIGTPDLFKSGDTWYLTFHGYGTQGYDCQIGLAYGEDLMNLTMVNTPIIPTSKEKDAADGGTTGRRDVIYCEEDGYFYMVYEISSDAVDGSFNLSRWGHTFARSKDFFHWEKSGVVVQNPSLGFGYDGPCFLERDGQMFVCMRNPSNGTTKMSLIPADK